jgi:hypothetical protein
MAYRLPPTTNNVGRSGKLSHRSTKPLDSVGTCVEEDDDDDDDVKDEDDETDVASCVGGDVATSGDVGAGGGSVVSDTI